VLLSWISIGLRSAFFGGRIFNRLNSQQPLVRFSFRKLRGAVQTLEDSTQLSEWKSHKWLLRISAAQFGGGQFRPNVQYGQLSPRVYAQATVDTCTTPLASTHLNLHQKLPHSFTIPATSLQQHLQSHCSASSAPPRPLTPLPWCAPSHPPHSLSKPI
jgi:hypothetical protein